MINEIVRIPTLPLDKMVDKEGTATPTEMTFRQTLISNLQTLFGSEGCVVPSQTDVNIALIQDNQYPDPISGAPVYTCGNGRILYDSVNNRILISIDNGSGIPVFKQVTLTNPSPPIP
jgi:hypothetical protein